ncbi:MAG TPA: BatD family protein [Rhodanobacteraceae bacterium]|nr:BatD family protein [Rhodanobacteraceae bacterium]
MMRRWWLVILLVALVPMAHAAGAATGPGLHAFLDRNHVSLGGTVTLNIQSSGALGTPDLSPLQKDFQVLGSSRSSSVAIVNGKTSRTAQLGIALKPLHAGTLTIPALDVGGAQTPPLSLQVGAAPAGGTGRVGDPVYMETSVLSSSPYVNEQTVYTVRLFYLPGVVDGGMSDPSADGARLIPLDRDHRYTVERNGYTYRVLEQSWALIPLRSGPITVQGPEFQGQQVAPGNSGTWFIDPNTLFNNPNALLNGRIPGFGKAIRADAPQARIDARAAPAHAGTPWLPARDLQLKLTGLPANGEAGAGVPLTVTLSISASGQPADALPEPELPPIAGARVYPDQTRDTTDDSGQWLQGTRTRSFAIVPEHGGSLTLPAITLDWWDVVHGRAEQASLPAHALQVGGSAAGAASASMPPAAATSAASRNAVPAPASTVATPAYHDASGFWRVVALASLALWMLALIAGGAWWWLQRRRTPPPPPDAQGRSGSTAGAAGVAPDADGGEIVAKADTHALRQETLEAARRGDAAACEHALLAWVRASHPQLASAGALRAALSDPAQRDAFDALQRARWRGGDAAAGCALVAQAFARGFAWRDTGKPATAREAELPPLYPS